MYSAPCSAVTGTKGTPGRGARDNGSGEADDDSEGVDGVEGKGWLCPHDGVDGSGEPVNVGEENGDPKLVGVGYSVSSGALLGVCGSATGREPDDDVRLNTAEVGDVVDRPGLLATMLPVTPGMSGGEVAGEPVVGAVGMAAPDSIAREAGATVAAEANFSHGELGDEEPAENDPVAIEPAVLPADGKDVVTAVSTGDRSSEDEGTAIKRPAVDGVLLSAARADDSVSKDMVETVNPVPKVLMSKHGT